MIPETLLEAAVNASQCITYSELSNTLYVNIQALLKVTFALAYITGIAGFLIGLFAGYIFGMRKRENES